MRQLNLYGSSVKEENSKRKEMNKHQILLNNLQIKFNKLQNELKRSNREIKDLQKQVDKQKSEADALQKENSKLKKICKALTTNPNLQIIKCSTIQIRGFPIDQFYDDYIYANGTKPQLIWTGIPIMDKKKYQNAVRNLEKTKKLTNLFYSSKEWGIRSAEILKRDTHKCECCGKKTNRVHHRSSATYNPDICLDPDNLVAMCKKCEDEIHNRKN